MKREPVFWPRPSYPPQQSKADWAEWLSLIERRIAALREAIGRAGLAAAYLCAAGPGVLNCLTGGPPHYRRWPAADTIAAQSPEVILSTEYHPLTRIEYIATTNVCTDRFVLWPLALTCGFPVVLFILWSGPLIMMFLLPFLFSAWIFSALLASGMAFFSARAHLWRRAFSLSVLPLVSLFGICNADTVWPLIIEAGENLHFQIMRRSYLEEVSKLPSAGEPRFALWVWGGFIIGCRSGVGGN